MQITAEINYSRLPLGAQDSMKQYIEVGQPVSPFLHAVLSNDLHESYATADDVNTHKLRDYVVFLHSQAPRGCWGSPAIVDKWLAHGGAQGEI